jgi:hypothetical protein
LPSNFISKTITWQLEIDVAACDVVNGDWCVKVDV